MIPSGSTRDEGVHDSHNVATNIIVTSFVVGDYITVFKPTHREHKVAIRWCGPRRVVTITGPAGCLVDNLTTGNREKVQALRLNIYNALLDGDVVPGGTLDLASRTSANCRNRQE